MIRRYNIIVHLKDEMSALIWFFKNLKYYGSLATFNRESNFATVVKFFNAISLALSYSLDLNGYTNHTEEFYSSCKAAFSAECSHCTRCIEHIKRMRSVSRI